MSSKIQIIPDNRQGQLNTAYLATIPGVLKIAEIVGIIPFRNSSHQENNKMPEKSRKFQGKFMYNSSDSKIHFQGIYFKYFI